MDREQARKAIQTAAWAGVFSCVVTLGITLYAMSSDSGFMGFSAYSLVDVAIIGGLTVGLFVKNRACAVLMLVYFIASKLILWAEAGKPSGLVTAILFGYFFFQGMRGTFVWHSEEGAAAPAAPAAGAAGGAHFKSREEYEQWKASRMAR